MRFRDVTAQGGVRFRHGNGAAGQKYFVETMGAGTAVFDYDNDGRLDLFFVNGRSLDKSRPGGTTPKLYRNESGGSLRFREVTREAGLALPIYGMGCAVGDYDNDGWRDLYVSAVLGPGRLFRNRQGRFDEVTDHAGVGNAGKWGTGCAWLDYDRDGLLDLYVASYVRYRSLKDDLPCYVREGHRSYCIPVAYEGSSGTLFRNSGGGRFEDVTRAVGLFDPKQKALGVATCDLNDDGWPDLVVANDTVPNRLFLNRQARFTESAMPAGIAFGPGGRARAGMGIDAADWRNQATLSVATTNFTGESIGLYVPSGSADLAMTDKSAELGISGPSESFLGFGIRFVDCDNDGFQDLSAVNGHVQDDIELLEPGRKHAQRALLFHNRRGERFEEIGARAGPAFSTPAVGRGLAAGDLDQDGRVDLVVTRNAGKAEVWRNETARAGHWLVVNLKGRTSNRDGLGARVTVAARGLRLTRWSLSGGSYLSESDHRLHFGLGHAGRVDQISVRWPSGRSAIYPGCPGDRVVTLEEPAE